jgi:hypothetical protein
LARCAPIRVTEATGADTVSDAEPERPSLVAVISVLPALMAVTSPLAETVATDVLLLDHVIVRPPRIVPSAARSVAVAVVVDPLLSVEAPNDTVTLDTDAVMTVSVAAPLRPSLLAVIVVVPAASAVTKPFAETDATDVLLDAQPNVRPLSADPLASRAVAVNCCEPPTATCVTDGLTTTDATGADTVSDAEPERPSLVAVISAVPALPAVTSPLAETVATSVLLLDHVTVRPVRIVPSAARAVAVAVVVDPLLNVAAPSATVTLATAIGLMVSVAAPLRPSLLAVIVVEPAVSAMTNPVAETVATDVLLDAQPNTRPLSADPLASRAVAVSC